MVIRSLFGAIIALTTIVPVRAAEHGFVERSLENADGTTAKYSLFIPHDYTPGKAAPVILFLHGAGEIGTDGKKPLKAGIAKSIREREKSFPALVVFPQAVRHEPGVLSTWQPGKVAGDRALAILAAVEREFKTDPKRTYLTGISMGGFGTWVMAAKYPDKWAAIVPVCGGGDSDKAATIKNVPCWCFHGADDPVVVVGNSRRMIDALKQAGGTPKYTEYPGVDHLCWDKAYGTDELWTWLFAQKLK